MWAMVALQPIQFLNGLHYFWHHSQLCISGTLEINRSKVAPIYLPEKAAIILLAFFQVLENRY